MSDLLSGLRPNVADTYELDQLRGTEAWDLALDRVAEALLAELDRLAAEEHTGPSDVDRGFSLGWNYALAEVRRAVAGGDDE